MIYHFKQKVMKTTERRIVKYENIKNDIEDCSNPLEVPDESIIFFHIYAEEFAPFDINGMPTIHDVTFFPNVTLAIRTMVYKN